MPTITVDPSGAVTRTADETPTGDLETPDFRAAGAAQVARAVQSGYLRTPGLDPIVPASVQARLAALSPRLGLTWNEDLGCFTLLLRWPEGDVRFQTIGSAHPYEIIGMCHPSVIGVHEIPTWVEQRLTLHAPSNPAVQQMLADEARALERQHAERQQALRDQGKQAVVEALSAATDVTAARHGKRRTKVAVPKGEA